MFLENKPTATISFTDIVQLMGGGTPKTDEDSFWNGNILFFTPKDILGIEKTSALIDNYLKRLRGDIGQLPDNIYKKGLEGLLIEL